jgi:hypothetical protein
LPPPYVAAFQRGMGTMIEAYAVVNSAGEYLANGSNPVRLWGPIETALLAANRSTAERWSRQVGGGISYLCTGIFPNESMKWLESATVISE